MFTAEVTVKIKKPYAEVYEAIKDMEGFPAIMRDVKSLKIIKRISAESLVTLWETEIDGAPLKWREEDHFDDDNLQLRFNMLEGDYKQYQGIWSVSKNHGVTNLSITASFDWGIPVLEKYVSKALETKAKRSLRGMLQAIKNKVEKLNV